MNEETIGQTEKKKNKLVGSLNHNLVANNCTKVSDTVEPEYHQSGLCGVHAYVHKILKSP